VGLGLSTKLSDNALLYMSLEKTIGETADGPSHVDALTRVKFLFEKGSRDSKVYNFKNPKKDEDY
jgi:hypothetical protein